MADQYGPYGKIISDETNSEGDRFLTYEDGTVVGVKPDGTYAIVDAASPNDTVMFPSDPTQYVTVNGTPIKPPKPVAKNSPDSAQNQKFGVNKKKIIYIVAIGGLLGYLFYRKMK